MAQEKPKVVEEPEAGIENVLGIVGAQGYMRNLGPGARHISKKTQTNYLLGLKNATARYGPPPVENYGYNYNNGAGNERGNEGPNNSGRARIHYAVIHGKKNLLRNLKQRGADLEMTLDGKTPLMLAVEANQPEMVEELCKLGANLNNRMRGNGETALHLAVLMGNFKIVNLLLNCGADANIGAGTIMTPLQNAAFNGNEQMMDLLLRRGAKKSIDAKSMSLSGQQAAIHVAIGAHCLGCVKMLVQAGADLAVQNRGGQTAFQQAESEYETWTQVVDDDEDRPYGSASTRAYHREMRDDAYSILRFLEEVTGQRSALIAGIIDGGRRNHKRKRRATRRRKMRSAHKSRKH
jgi:ankyrin repeat protein